MDIELKELLGMLFQRQDATQTIWTFMSGVVALVVGLVSTKDAARLDKWARIGITVVAIGFAGANWSALNAILDQRDALRLIAQELIKQDPVANLHIEEIVEAVKAPDRWKVACFHGLLDLTMVIAIWGSTVKKAIAR